MIPATQLRVGSVILHQGELYRVVQKEHVTPGKGRAHVQTKLRRLSDGIQSEQRFRPSEGVETPRMDTQILQYLYSAGDQFHFMNNETFEQIAIPIEGLEERQLYLKEGETYQLVVWEGTPLDIKLPYKMVFIVTQAEAAVKGDTVSGSTKSVTIETGATIKVPLFIKEGDRILVNTDTGEYVERAN